MTPSKPPKKDNLKGLVQDLQIKLDERMIELRQGTSLEHVRPADAKTFMMISRGVNTIGLLSSSLNISRQAAHQSILRLIELEAVQLEPVPGRVRDKVAALTPKGQSARLEIAQHLRVIESEAAQVIGKENLETLRNLLVQLLADS